MNTQQIQYLLEVYEAKSMSKAAAKLYVSQPNLSNGIRALESELGFPIFKRVKYGVTPTENGLQVIRQARQIWESYQKMQQINTGGSRKHLHVGGLPVPAVYRAFEHFCLTYQEEYDADFLLANCEKFGFDLFVLSDFDIQITLTLPKDTDSFITQADTKGVLVTALRDLPIVLRIGPNHPLYHQPDISPSDFVHDIFVDYTGGFYQSYPGLSRYVPIDRKRTIMVTDRTTKHNLVSKGSFISLGCKLPADMDELYGFRNIPLEGMAYTLFLLERKDQRRSAEVQKYLQFLYEELEMI